MTAAFPVGARVKLTSPYWGEDPRRKGKPFTGQIVTIERSDPEMSESCFTDDTGQVWYVHDDATQVWYGELVSQRTPEQIADAVEQDPRFSDMTVEDLGLSVRDMIILAIKWDRAER